MSNVFILDKALLAWCCRVIRILTFKGLNTGHFVIANEKLTLFQQFSGPAIKFVNEFAFDVKLLIFGRIQPILALVGTN